MYFLTGNTGGSNNIETIEDDEYKMIISLYKVVAKESREQKTI